MAVQEDDGKLAAGHANIGYTLLTGTCCTVRRSPSWAASAAYVPCPAQPPSAQLWTDEDLFGAMALQIRNCPQSEALPPRSAASCSQVQCS